MATVSPMRTVVSDANELTRWIQRQKEESCDRLVLRQKTPNEEIQIREWRLERTSDVAALAQTVFEYASDDGRHFRGPTLYGLFSYRDGEHAPVERKFLRFSGAPMDDRIEESEPADVRGITSQLMRHNEIATRIAIGQTAEIIQQYQRMLEARDRRIEELESRHSEVLELHEKLLSMQHQREMDRVRAQRDEQRAQFFREKLDMLAPVLVSKFMGANGQGSAKSAVLGEEMIRQFLKSLRPDQFDRIMGGLDPEQAALIGQIYVAYGERETANDAAKAAHAAQTEE